MARQISRAEAWEKAHEVFSQVNFSAFDYNSIKESLLDYVKLYFPEDFNDYIESSEFIAILELFAYVGEQLSYRLDMNAHENFITTAQRKESILRLAKLISYKASRNIPARGLVKLTSISTTETVFDSAGRNLAGRRIYWNDNNNPDWREQFILVMNRVMEQEFGTVSPNERVQVDDVLFELYTLNNNPISTVGKNVFSYSATTGSGQAVSMELVPTELTENGPVERRPELNSKFSLMYASDGLGDSSDTTGFMVYTKQGSLTYQPQSFDGVTPNQTFDVTIDNINETDLWLNHVNPNTGQILTDDPNSEIFPHLVSEDLRYGEWIEVDLANAQNIIFNTNRNRHKYEVETLADDQIRIIFGDGEFSDIPSGLFHLWYRTSANQDLFIEKTAVTDKSSTFTYNDVSNSVQTVTFTYSLISSLQNASASEDIEHIRRVAPSVYYTQDRMVNNRDYNVFMLQDPSILRMRSVNRTFAGDSKYIAWHDPREYYEDVKIFGDDLALYWKEEEPTQGGLEVVSTAVNSESMLENYIEPLLSTTDFFAKIGPELQARGQNPGDMRRYFKTSTNPYSFGNDPSTGQNNETSSIIAALDAATTTTPIVDIFYSIDYDEWTIAGTYGHPCDPETKLPPTAPDITGCVLGPAESFWMIRVEAQFEGSNLSGWTVRWLTRRMIAQSEDTKFWNTNDTTSIVNFDTLNSVDDTMVVLGANINADETGLLGNNRDFAVLGQELVEQSLPTAGLPDIHKLSVLPPDRNDDGVPDDLLQDELFDGTYTGTWPADPSNPQVGDIPTGVDPLTGPYIDLSKLGTGRKINNSSTKGLDVDCSVVVNTSPLQFAFSQLVTTAGETGNLILERIGFATVYTPSPGDSVSVTINDFVYMSREDTLSEWTPQPDTDTMRQLYLVEDNPDDDERLYNRYSGRFPLNFAWFHYTPRLNLVDPAASNIIDMYIITVGYYTGLIRWLANKTDVEPTAPTPLELRNSYSELIDNKMISDTVILHSGNFKILFGSRAIPQLRAAFKVVRPKSSSMTNNQVKVGIISAIREFFDIDTWEFGETFFYTELAAAIHVKLGPEIDSILLVPLYSQNQFGDMLQVSAREDEMFIPDISTADIEIVEAFTPQNLRYGSGTDTDCRTTPCTIVVAGTADPVCTSSTSVTGLAIAGCAVPDATE